VSGRYFARKLLQAIVTVAAIILLNFVLFRLMPGSPDRATRNPHLTPELIAQNRARWGLDKPLFPDQLVDYVGETLTGDLGYSIKYRGQPVVEVVVDAMGPTILLIGLGEVIAIVVGLAIGARSGWARGGIVDRIGNGLSLIFYSMPYFVIGMPLIIIFAAGLHWFPTSGMSSPGANRSLVDSLYDIGRHLVLPLTAVSVGLIGAYSILMRASIIETRAEDYVTTARAKGLAGNPIILRHAFPNALIPVITVVGIAFALLMAGAVVVENVFSIKGLGRLLIQSILNRDYPTVQGAVLVVSAIFIFSNLVVDLLYTVIDPRIRYDT